jgi:hypothetical protein
MTEHATIVGTVEYRLGDGPNREIPKGPVSVELSTNDVTLTWGEGETRESTAIPRTEYSRYVVEKAIELRA